MEAKKATKPKAMEAEPGGFEVVLTVCRVCRDANEVVRVRDGLLCFSEYYCVCGGSLEIQAALIPPR